jgi:hypothetical protein
VLEREIYLAANQLIDHFGKDAADRAAERAAALKKIGDVEGFARFVLILKAIAALQSDAPVAGARLH